MDDMNQTPGKTSPILIIAVIVVLLGVGGAAGWYFATHRVVPGQVVTPTSEQPDTTKTDTNDSTPPAASKDSDLTWQTPASVNWPATMFDKDTYSDPTALKVGTFTDGPYKGGDLLLVDAQENAPAFHSDFFHFVKLNGKYTLISNYSDEVQNFSREQKPTPESLPFDVDTDLKISGLDFPSEIKGPSSGQTLKLAEDKWTMFNSATLDFLFKEPTLGNVYVDKPDGAWENGFYVRAPDGTRRVYYVDPGFIKETDTLLTVPEVTWNDGKKNSDQYFYVSQGGCGAKGYADVVRTIPQTDLVAAGKTSTGDTVYELKDPNSKYLKDIYNNEYAVYGDQQKLSYDAFLKIHPVFFWKDSFGRLIQFTNNMFVPPAECGKPVIYLYPQTATDVSVKLYPQGGFSKTEPAYNTGWNVTAYPNGKLVEKTSGVIYPYLFWEGRGGQYSAPTKGFVVAQKDVHDFLVAKLHALGLNDQESSDFIEFWEPRMQGSNYYFVGFYGKAVMNELAPLDVTPKPDTVIRVLMDFAPLSAPIAVEPQVIHTPVRSGFTLVEWGGVLRGN